MSGHSKWAKVKHQKAAKDPKRGMAFSKITNLITVASREGGDINTNPRLRMAVEKARELGMAKESVDKAIKRGSGEAVEGKVPAGQAGGLEEITCEAYGPGGAAILIQVITSNKNRALAEIRHILSLSEAKMANEGSVKWMFNEKGRITIPKDKWNDNLALQAIERGAEEIKEKEEAEIFTSLGNLNNLKSFFEGILGSEGIKTEIEYVSKQSIKISDEETKNKLNVLFEKLDEHQDVEEIYSNADMI